MWTTLVICLSLTAHLHAGIIGMKDNKIHRLSKTKQFSKELTFDIDEALANISKKCLTGEDHVKLAGNWFGPSLAQMFNADLIPHALIVIAHTEMRAALGFAKSGPWTHYKTPNAQEMVNATPEQYFEAMTRDKERSLDSTRFLEKNFPTVIAFLDERVPEIRQVIRAKLEEYVRRNMKKTIDGKAVNQLIVDYNSNINPGLWEAVSLMIVNYECMRKL